MSVNRPVSNRLVLNCHPLHARQLTTFRLDPTLDIKLKLSLPNVGRNCDGFLVAWQRVAPKATYGIRRTVHIGPPAHT